MNKSPSAKTFRAEPIGTYSSAAMTFDQAIAEVIRGKRITKLEWDDNNAYGVLRNERLMIKLEDGWHLWIVSAADMFGDDWVAL